MAIKPMAMAASTAAAAILASGCSAVSEHKTHVNVNSGGVIRLAVIPKSVGLDFWEKVHRGAQCAASQQRGVSVVWNGVSDETNVAGQIDLLQNYIGQGVNGLVYAATDSTALTEVSTTASRAGIKVLNIDSGTDPQPKDVPLLATDNEKGAKLAADALAKAIGPKGGKIAVIAFHAGSQTNDQRVNGFTAGLKKHKNLELVETQYSENDYNTALTVTQNVLTAHPDLKGIFAANEASDVGAVEAVRLAHLKGSVKIVGWDTSPDEVEGIREGMVTALISQDPFRMGYDGVRAAVAQVRSHRRPRSEDTGVVVVTKRNLGDPKVRQFVAPACRGSR
jgi:ribose transport system substrate-binding protein